MRSFTKRKPEISTVKDLWKFSKEAVLTENNKKKKLETTRKKMNKTKKTIVYVDISPPCEERVDIQLNAFKFWTKGTKQCYETWDNRYYE